jgi:hypothetical protein
MYGFWLRLQKVIGKLLCKPFDHYVVEGLHLRCSDD